jgi:hypothetical protein
VRKAHGYGIILGDLEAEEADGRGDLGDLGDGEGVQGLEENVR